MTGRAETQEHVIPPLPIEVEPWATHDWSYSGNGNHQWIYKFPNGFGASVIRGPYTYGGPEGFYELGVLAENSSKGKWGLTYETPITDDVLGWQTLEDIAAVLVRIAAL